MVTRVSTAAATQVKDGTPRIGREEWQSECYAFAEEIGELGYVLTVIADTAAKGQLVVVERDPETGATIEPERDGDGVPIIDGARASAERVLLAFRGPGGDHRQLLAAGIIHDMVAGECYLLGQPIDKTNQIAWEMVSVHEIKEDNVTHRLVRQTSVKSGSQLAAGSESKTTVPLDPNAYLARFHRSDWKHSGDPTSTLRRNAGVCREIVLLAQLIEAHIKSRLSADALYVPEELSFPGPEDQGGDDPQEDINRFMEALVEHLSGPVQDRRSGAALVPLLITGPAEYADKVKLIQLSDTNTDLQWITEQMDKALRRLAGGLDIPLEIMLGLGSTNHWSASVLDTSFVEKHVVPVADRLAAFFTLSMFRRMLVVAEKLSEQDAERFSIEYDPAEILTRVDASASADALHAALLISDDARIEAHGFDPDVVRPGPEEKLRRYIERLALSPSVNNRVLVTALGLTPEAMADLGMDPALFEQWLQRPSGAQDPGTPPEAGMGPEVGTVDGQSQDSLPPPPGGNEAPPIMPAEAMQVVIERVRTAASAAMDRALEKAANRVVTNTKSLSPETRSRAEAPQYRASGSAKQGVLRLLSQADWRAISLTPEGLLHNAWDEFTAQAVMWLTDHLVASGVEPMRADEDARRVVSEIVTQLDARALSAFRRPLDREHGLSVPWQLVAECCVARVR
jgi:hypothetical protein